MQEQYLELNLMNWKVVSQLWKGHRFLIYYPSLDYVPCIFCILMKENCNAQELLRLESFPSNMNSLFSGMSLFFSLFFFFNFVYYVFSLHVDFDEYCFQFDILCISLVVLGCWLFLEGSRSFCIVSSMIMNLCPFPIRAQNLVQDLVLTINWTCILD